AGDPRRWILQGVNRHRTFEPGPSWVNDERRTSVLVFIGMKLPSDTLEQGLTRCRADMPLD
ncbi:MAG: GTP-binding protein, partial [Burkholderiales bacterium]|nr:GTP-binding protein [Burkholderiales bacterium]